MNAKEYLRQIRLIDIDIACRIEEVEKLKSMLVKSPQFKEDSVQEAKRGFRDDTYVKIIELSDEINRKIDELVAYKKQVGLYIDRMKSKEYAVLLRMKYLSSKSWDDIADALYVSKSHSYRLHGEALREFDEILRLNDKK